MIDRLESPKLRLNSARDDIIAVDKLNVSFFGSQPYESFIEADPRSGHELHKVRLTKPLPAKLGHMCARIGEDLRSALEHCGFAAALAAGKPTTARHTHFPFCGKEADKNSAMGKCADIPTEIRELFWSFKPYKGGNDSLWALSEMRNTSEHRFVRPVAHAARDSLMNIEVVSGGFRVPAPHWDAERNELTMLSVTPGTVVNVDMQLRFDVVLGDIPIVGGNPVVPAFRRLADLVEHIISATEAEMNRLFPVA